MTSAGATAGEMNVLSTYGTCLADDRRSAARRRSRAGTAPRSRATRSPVRAPSDTPAPDSTYVVTDDGPSRRRPPPRPSRRAARGAARAAGPSSIEEAARAPDRHRGADRVEEVGHEQHEDRRDERPASARRPGWRARARRRSSRSPAEPGHSAILSGPSSTPKIRPSDGRGDDPDQDRAADAAHAQHDRHDRCRRARSAAGRR